MKNQLWKYWKGHCYQLLYCVTKKNCYCAECWLETIQGQGICSLILSPPTTGHLAAYVASPLGICHPKLKKGKGRGRGRKVRKGKGALSPQFLPPSSPPPPPPQATRIYNLIYGRPGTNLPSIAFLFNLMLYRTIAAGIRQEINVVWKNSLLCGPSPPPCLGISC